MYCKYFTVKSQKLKKYKFCRLNKQVIHDECKKCLKFEYRQYKTMKKKSNKLSKLEKERDKNIVKKGICQNCGRYSNRLDPHEVYGGSNRQRSIKNGFVKIICRKCHDDEKEIIKLRKETQLEYEKNHTREEFIQLIGKSYLINGEEKKWQKEECSQKP